MTDPIDRGCDREEELRQDALMEQNRRAGLEGKTVEDSAFFCHVCDEPIPQGRREAYPGVVLCIACQTEFEKVFV